MGTFLLYIHTNRSDSFLNRSCFVVLNGVLFLFFPFPAFLNGGIANFRERLPPLLFEVKFLHLKASFSSFKMIFSSSAA